MEAYLNQFLLFILVLTRLGGLVIIAPVVGSRAIPMRIRAFLAIGLALIITPVYWNQSVPVPNSILELAVIAGRELLLGLAIGLAMMILFTGLQITGMVIGQMSGMSLADVFDPTQGASVPVFTQLLDSITLAVFVTLGGHRQLLRALLDTFHYRPPGTLDFPPEIVEALAGVMAESFVVGIRAAAPVMVALMLSVLVLGLISRTLPQLNILAIGFSLNATVMLVTLSLSLSAIAWVVQESSGTIIENVKQAVVAGP